MMTNYEERNKTARLGLSNDFGPASNPALLTTRGIGTNRQLYVPHPVLYYIKRLIISFFFLGRLTDEFRLCCLAREVKVCLPPADEFSSCEDLMSNLVLRVCVWVLASVAILGNILVIACRASYKHTNQVHRLMYFSCDYY